jgi:hypothetical protein
MASGAAGGEKKRKRDGGGGNNGEDTPMHPPTRAIYVRNLTRPLKANNLRDHLQELAAGAGAVAAFHVEPAQTHALALFSSIEAAQQAQAGLHGAFWPEGPVVGALWADFIPEDKFQEWAETEEISSLERKKARRWEIVYTKSGNEVTATLELAEEAQQAKARRTSSAQSATQKTVMLYHGDANAIPLGPRRPSQQGADRRTSNYDRDDTGVRSSAQRDTTEANAESSKAKESTKSVIDAPNPHFPFTTAKPKLNYQPVPQDLADKRLGELAKQTSRDWKEARRKPLNGREAQLKRYTFETSMTAKIVDGGADFGNFGVAGYGAR